MAALWGGRSALEEALADAVAKAQASRLRAMAGKPKKLGRAKVMDAATAQRMAADLQDYDSKIVAGRLTQ